MTEPVVLTDLDSRGIMTVTLNRPEVFNGYNEDMVRTLSETIPALGADPAVRILVFRGAGKHFSAGADVNWFKELAVASDDDKLMASGYTTGAMRALFEFPKPTIALVQNACFGGGAGYAAACDIVVASEDARFAITEVRLGITPAPILPEIIAAIGARQSRRYVLSAETFDVVEARRIGLVHEICPVGGLDDAAAPIIDALLLGGPQAISDTKKLILELGGGQINDAPAARLAGISADGRGTEEGVEGFTAFLDKRKPNWYAGGDA